MSDIEVAQWISSALSIAKSEASALIDEATKSVKELMAQPPATVEMFLFVSERLETVVGQPCESLIEFFLSCSQLRRAAPPRTRRARRGFFFHTAPWLKFCCFFFFFFGERGDCLADLYFSDTPCNLPAFFFSKGENTLPRSFSSSDKEANLTDCGGQHKPDENNTLNQQELDVGKGIRWGHGSLKEKVTPLSRDREMQDPRNDDDKDSSRPRLSSVATSQFEPQCTHVLKFFWVTSTAVTWTHERERCGENTSAAGAIFQQHDGCERVCGHWHGAHHVRMGRHFGEPKRGIWGFRAVREREVADEGIWDFTCKLFGTLQL